VKRFIIIGTLILFLVGSISLAFQNQESADPVDWRELQKFLVDLSGFEKDGDPQGETVSIGDMKWTHVEQDYSANDQHLTLEIIDSAYVSMALQSFQMASMMEIDTNEEYIKKIEIKGYPGIKNYTYDDKEAAVMLLVSDRFLVRLEGDPFEDAEALVELIQMVDLQGLAGLAE
jgi:hypothetical protein